METSTDQHVFLVDKFIITDSSGRIIFDGTLESISTFIKSRASTGSLPSSGFSIKTDENGVAIMTEKRKVRKDFDPKQPISVDVSDCTEDEKEEVQQAFFDVGLRWSHKFTGEEYQFLGALQYTNTYDDGNTARRLLMAYNTEGCNTTPAEFLELVYEPEQQGHIHAHLMAQYADDAKTSKTPWELWEYLDKDDGWTTHRGAPGWYETSEYRRKSKTHIVNGVEIPDLRVTPELGDKYYLADPTTPELTELHTFVMNMEKLWVERGLTYQNTEEGKQAAILHSKSMLGMVQE